MKTIDDLVKDAGKVFSNKILIELAAELSDEEIINWFYQAIPSLGNQSPYDLCKKGEYSIAESALNAFAAGVDQ